MDGLERTIMAHRTGGAMNHPSWQQPPGYTTV